jgi:hypothetical protein
MSSFGHSRRSQPGRCASSGPSRRVGASKQCAPAESASETACYENGQRTRRRNGIGRTAAAGCCHVVTEEPGALPNWVAAAGIMEAALTKKFSKRVVELRKTDPLIDWSEVDKRQDRRVVKFLSEARD